MPNWFVVAMGIGTVFVGLICIVILCKVVSLFCRMGGAEKTPAASANAGNGTSAGPIENRQEIIAAVAAVIAEELGTEPSALRIHSFKKI